jgi:hypothetical protein
MHTTYPVYFILLGLIILREYNLLKLHIKQTFSYQVNLVFDEALLEVLLGMCWELAVVENSERLFEVGSF